MRSNEKSSSKASLIYALNAAMHKDELPSIGLRDSYFDESTRTLYCSDSKTSYSEKRINEAIRYFNTANLFYTSKNDDDSFKKAEYCKMASEALKIITASK